MSKAGVTSMLGDYNKYNLLRFSFTTTSAIPSSSDATRGKIITIRIIVL
jgi:hypothetical protein